MSTLFVTGSGTDIGKTFVCCRLLEALPAACAMRCIKPVLTGFDPDRVAQSDTGRLLAARGLPIDDAHVAATSPWRFREPLSADMAAAREDRSIPFAEVVEFCHAPPGIELNLVEGLGGVMAPLDASHTILDLIEALGAPTLLVVGSYLGSLSHTLTALAALEQRATDVLAIVVSRSELEPVPADETVRTLGRFTGTTPIFVVPRREDANAAELAALVRKRFDLG